MNNTLKRVIFFSAAMPSLIILIFYLPHLGYIGHTALLALIGFACGKELHRMLASGGVPPPRWSILLPGMAPILGWTVSMEWLPAVSGPIALVIALLWAFGGAVSARENEVNRGIERIGKRMIMVFYPGFFLWWIQALTRTPMPAFSLLIFLLLVSLNDVAAWFFGRFLGRFGGVVPVSPNKTLEGFIAGIAASIAVVIAASYWIPDFFPHPRRFTVLLGPLIGITVILGDLIESAVKRSAGMKDSGRIILGRGGMLDSVDSYLPAAPVFVLFLQLGG